MVKVRSKLFILLKFDHGKGNKILEVNTQVLGTVPMCETVTERNFPQTQSINVGLNVCLNETVVFHSFI